MTNSIISAILAVLMAVLNFLGIGVKPNKDFRVTTYLVANNVTSENSLHAEDFDIITDVIVFGAATFDAKGQVNEEEKLPFVLDILRSVIGERNVKIHLNLLGPGPLTDHGVWEENMKDLSAQHKLAFQSGVLEKNIIAIAEKYDLDGIYFDYEYPASFIDWMIFSKFLVGLDKLLGDKILGIAAFTDIMLTPSALEAVDRVEAMLYDIYDDADGKHSTFEKAKSLVSKFLVKGVPREKLGFGIPFYARPCDHGAYWFGYGDYCDRLDENGFYYDEGIDKTFWFNTPDVVKEKTEYAIGSGLGGVMIWHYSCDLASSDENSLLRAIGEAIEETSQKQLGIIAPC